MKVRAKKKHLNAYGDTPHKFPGKHYELPDAAAMPLLELGIVEQIDDEAPAADDGEADAG